MVEEYSIKILKKAIKDKEKIKQYPALKNNVNNLKEIIRKNPYQTPPSYEVLVGDMKGYFSRRINKQHRLVYEVVEEKKEIRIISMWTHYEF